MGDRRLYADSYQLYDRRLELECPPADTGKGRSVFDDQEPTNSVKKITAEPQRPLEPIQAAPVITAWRTDVDPSGKGQVEKINQALDIYKSMGMTKQGAAMLIANFLAESGLNPANCAGDGGTACGLGQWRFARQEGLPISYEDQLRWAVETEMVRDSGGHGLKQALFDPAATPDDIYAGLQAWERWGIAGDRYTIGTNLINTIKEN